jgi:hypothetical protein
VADLRDENESEERINIFIGLHKMERQGFALNKFRV